MDMPATLMNLVTLNRFGRVWPLFFSMTFAGLVCLIASIGHNWPAEVLMVMAAIAKFGIASAYDILYQVASEIYPTVIRGSGIGFSSIVGEMFSIAMPYIIYSAGIYHLLPMVIIGILAMMSGCCTTSSRVTLRCLAKGCPAGITTCISSRCNGSTSRFGAVCGKVTTPSSTAPS